MDLCPVRELLPDFLVTLFQGYEASPRLIMSSTGLVAGLSRSPGLKESRIVAWLNSWFCACSTVPISSLLFFKSVRLAPVHCFCVLVSTSLSAFPQPEDHDKVSHGVL